MTKITFKKT